MPTHESNYAYRYVRPANSFSYKAIYSLANGHFEQWCIIQYWWKFCPSHIEMCLTQFNKFQLCTSNLKVPTHESNYVYRYVRFANSFSYKAIFTLDNRDFEQWCIIQYRWKFCPSHIEMCLTHKFQLCTSNLKVPTHEYVYRYVRHRKSFKDKILTLGNHRFWARCIIQYDENSVRNTLNMCLTRNKYQLCTSNLKVPTHESNYVYLLREIRK